MASIARAVHRLQVGWGAYSAGLLSFDFSRFDAGGDVFGLSPLDSTFGGTPFDDVSARYVRGTAKRGRDDNVATMLAGSATFDLRDPDGIFNPENVGYVWNEVPNASFEAAVTTGWTPNNGGSGITPAISPTGDIDEDGTYSMLIVAQNAELVGINKYVYMDPAALPVMAVVGGERVYIRAWFFGDGGWDLGVRIASGAGTGGVYLQGGNVELQPLPGSSLNTGTIREGIFTVPAGATGIGLAWLCNVPASTTRFARVDGHVMRRLVAGEVPTRGYRDPSTDPLATWEGTPFLSRTIYGAPLRGQLEDRLHPVKWEATTATGKRGIFAGWVRRFVWEPNGRKGITQLECVDGFWWLERNFPTIPSTGPTTTGAAIALILDAAGLGGGAGRSLDAGDAIPDFVADGSQSGLQLLEGLLNAERGVFYIDGDGVSTYRSRVSRLLKVSAFTFDGRVRALGAGVDFDQARTRVTVTRTQNGYSAIRSSSTTLAQKLGVVDLQEITTPYLPTDSDADSIAAWILTLVQSALPPMYDFAVPGRDSDYLDQILDRDLVDRITANQPRGNNQGDYHIDRLEITYDGGRGGSVDAAWLLSKVSTLTPIIVDSSTFDAGRVFV